MLPLPHVILLDARSIMHHLEAFHTSLELCASDFSTWAAKQLVEGSEAILPYLHYEKVLWNHVDGI
jgi:hypothetical protein